MIRRTLMMCLVALAACGAVARASETQHVFLVQNSGWMEPFYTDPDSQLKPLVAAVASAVAEPGDAVSVLAFSQSAEGNESPVVVYRGTDPTQVGSALQPLTLARRSGGAFADTDFQEAIRGAISGPLEGRSGILWIFTNNRNSPGNDPDTIARNREFYRLIHLEPAITRSLAFPLRMDVRGQHYQASGLMVYALAYGDLAGLELSSLVDRGALSRVFTIPPARLKPLDREAVRIIPKRVTNSENIQVALGPDGRTLVFDVEAAQAATNIRIEAQLENLFHPYEIVSANVHGRLVMQAGQALALPVSPAAVKDLVPGDAATVQLDLRIPDAAVPSPWSMQAVWAMGKRMTIPAAVEIRLDEQKLRVSEPFRDKVMVLFPGDPLSDVFTPPLSIDASSATIPIQLRIQYPLWPLMVAFAAMATVVMSGLALLVLVGGSGRHEVWIDGSKRFVILKPFRTVELQDASGNTVGRITRGIGRPRIVSVADGHTVSVARS